MPIRDQFAIMTKDHLDDTPVGIVTAINGQISVLTNNQNTLDWIAGVCSEEYPGWDMYLESEYPISMLFRSGNTPLLMIGDPNNATDKRVLNKAIKDLGSVKFDAIVYPASKSTAS